ncbi:LPG20 [Candida margitis]|uniref:LPG20 n=1 Tax=Candida margitis TaxID=1775924 RepID=UPI002226FC54|nr:LPG20 [Candida margitis]KAI5961759.1 LPG20 [Candida margitis]
MSIELKYNNLGDSGLKIAPLIVGCMSYGSKKWADWILEDEEEIFKILKKCYDVGLRTFDTADVYSNGKSEIILGKFLKKYDIPRERVVILSKCFMAMNPRDPDFNAVRAGSLSDKDFANSKGLSRKHILDAVNESVKRLGTYVDVLQIHRLDPTTPKKEIMKALNDVVDQGLARYIGASTMKATEFAELQFIAEQNGWYKFISMQNYYNLIYREEEREMIPFCKNNDLSKVGIIPWSPIARGVLTRPIDAALESKRNKTDKTFALLGLDALTDADTEIIKRVEKVAKDHGESMAVIATAWVISKGCNPIVGLNSEKRVEDIIRATTVKLSDEEVKYLEEPYKPKESLS